VAPIGLDALEHRAARVFLIDTDGSIRFSAIGDNQKEFPAHEDILRAVDVNGK
jgi:hypothetical protein